MKESKYTQDPKGFKKPEKKLDDVENLKDLEDIEVIKD